ncbi:transcriptional regulator [Deltaproteobacteria bacterium TL4]
MISIKELLTPGEIQTKLAEMFKKARLEQTHSRAKASKLTGVPEATLKSFERTGQISLRQFLMLCHVYGDLRASELLFPQKQKVTLEDVLEVKTKPNRQRGRS